MILRLLLVVSAIVLGGAFAEAYMPANDPGDDEKERERLIMMAVLRLVDQRHFQEVELNDEFSKKAFKTYMNRLDGGKRFITLDQYDLMDDYEEEIDDAVEELNLDFFEISYEQINKSVEKVRGMYPVLLDVPFDFTIDEDIELDGEKMDYAKNDQELKERWRLYLKYETLTRLASKLDEQESED